MSSRTTYSAESLHKLRTEPARRFLSEIGLPSEHLLFTSIEPALDTVETNTGVRSLLRLGVNGDVEEFCADVDSGEIVSVVLVDRSIWHVNATPEQFSACLDEFASRYPYGNAEEDLDDLPSMADALREALTEIDGTAFDEVPGFWNTLMFDVAAGDYSET